MGKREVLVSLQEFKCRRCKIIFGGDLMPLSGLSDAVINVVHKCEDGGFGISDSLGLGPPMPAIEESRKHRVSKNPSYPETYTTVRYKPLKEDD